MRSQIVSAKSEKKEVTTQAGKAGSAREAAKNAKLHPLHGREKSFRHSPFLPSRPRVFASSREIFNFLLTRVELRKVSLTGEGNLGPVRPNH
jgi:hypothetical protein